VVDFDSQGRFIAARDREARREGRSLAPPQCDVALAENYKRSELIPSMKVVSPNFSPRRNAAASLNSSMLIAGMDARVERMSRRSVGRIGGTCAIAGSLLLLLGTYLHPMPADPSSCLADGEPERLGNRVRKRFGPAPRRAKHLPAQGHMTGGSIEGHDPTVFELCGRVQIASPPPPSLREQTRQPLQFSLTDFAISQFDFVTSRLDRASPR
jgi:hypothetical protein